MFEPNRFVRPRQNLSRSSTPRGPLGTKTWMGLASTCGGGVQNLSVPSPPSRNGQVMPRDADSRRWQADSASRERNFGHKSDIGNKIVALKDKCPVSPSKSTWDERISPCRLTRCSLCWIFCCVSFLLALDIRQGDKTFLLYCCCCAQCFPGFYVYFETLFLPMEAWFVEWFGVCLSVV